MSHIYTGEIYPGEIYTGEIYTGEIYPGEIYRRDILRRDMRRVYLSGLMNKNGYISSLSNQSFALGLVPSIFSLCLHFLPAWLTGYHNMCYPALKIAESQYKTSSEEQVFTTLQRVPSL